MKIAIIGCGYVADQYLNNIKSHPGFIIQGAFDQNHHRRDEFCKYFSLPAYPTLEAVMEDSSVEMILNLTNPRSHFSVSAAAINANKHVYTEKPLGMDMKEARLLIDMAKEKNVRLGCAPCSVLSDTAQTLWKAIREGAIGKVRLVYANFDDGMIAPKMKPWTWQTNSGAYWPAKDEFEIGCTYEHAGYFLTWLAAFFGPAQRVTAFSSCQIPDKGIPVEQMAPDFSTGCIEYNDGVVARVTAGLVAPRDKSMTVIGDEGVLFVPYLRNDQESVLIHRDTDYQNLKLVERLKIKVKSKVEYAAKRLKVSTDNLGYYQRYPMLKSKSFQPASSTKLVDFLRGPQDMLDSIKNNQPHRLSAELGLHIVELIECLQYPQKFNYHKDIETTFPAIEPLIF
ncbi:MAG: Gfo/Idh/MocA family oxidoreductase [Sphaerospermopsis sp. SIO1G2]|nr:Gfo/Idh/MocA family oxidoreductase [Sphaerospermopsis sp. SIO1G1]NET71685.1 Gfo/Idh/MocA family oxidoreductase [Sphaerospermopsis sp. SIO1G2]